MTLENDKSDADQFNYSAKSFNLYGCKLVPNHTWEKDGSVLTINEGYESDNSFVYKPCLKELDALTTTKSVKISPTMAVKEWLSSDNLSQLHAFDNDPERKLFLAEYFDFMGRRGTPVSRVPVMARHPLDLFKLYKIVKDYGGFRQVVKKRKWSKVVRDLNLPSTITSAAFTLRTQYVKYLYPFECSKRSSAIVEDQEDLDITADNRKKSKPNIDYSPPRNGSPTKSPEYPSPAGPETPVCCKAEDSRRASNSVSPYYDNDVSSSVHERDDATETRECGSMECREISSASPPKRSKVDQAVETEHSMNRKMCKCCGKDMERQNRDAKLKGIIMPHFQANSDQVNGMSNLPVSQDKEFVRNSTPVLTNKAASEGTKDLSELSDSVKSPKSDQSDASSPRFALFVDEGMSKVIRSSQSEYMQRSPASEVESVRTDSSQENIPQRLKEERNTNPLNIKLDAKFPLKGSRAEQRWEAVAPRCSVLEEPRDARKSRFQIPTTTSLWIPDRFGPYPRGSVEEEEYKRSAFRRVNVLKPKTSPIHPVSPSYSSASSKSFFHCNGIKESDFSNYKDERSYTPSTTHESMMNREQEPIGTRAPMLNDSRYANEHPALSPSRGPQDHETFPRAPKPINTPNTIKSTGPIMFQIHEQTNQLLFITVEIGGKKYEGPIFAENQGRRF